MAISNGRVVLEISSTDLRTLECRSLFGAVSLPVSAITLIDIRRWNRGFIRIRSEVSTIFLRRDMPGALAAMDELMRLNPTIEVRK